ncbi:hypothetical protein HDU76_011476, partial [Blyttiomyces sp. JEL0837]
MNDGLRVAAHWGNWKVIEYIMNCDDINIKSLDYQCFITCLSENRPESLHTILTSKRQIDVNGPFERKLFKGHWKETLQSEYITFFDCLLYEACWLRCLGIVKVLVELERCNLKSHDGIAFRIAAGILEEEWVSSKGYLCMLSESEASFTESESESFDGDDEDDWIDEDNSGGDLDSYQDGVDADGSGGDGIESNPYALYRYEYNDRIEICKYLLEHDAVVPGMSTKVLEASVSLPADLFMNVVGRGGFTQDRITSIAALPDSFRTATLANQSDTLNLFLATSERVSCKVLRCGLTAALKCGLELFFQAMVYKLSDEKDLDEENADEWSTIMVGAIKHGWCTGLVMEIWARVGQDAQIEVLTYLHENGLNDVVEELRRVDEDA